MQLYLWFFIIAILVPWQTKVSYESWLVESTSTLQVDGKTNINSFRCKLDSYERKTDVLDFEKVGNECKINGKLTIPIQNFDCHNRMMTKDLQKTLKSNIFPEMIISFKSFSDFPSNAIGGKGIVGKADIKLAGVVKNFEIKFSANRISSKEIQLIGRRTILFTDFGLVPPSKLGGTIKVKNELDVEFTLFLTKTI